MEEKIVVPLDGSEIGESAIPYVEDLISKLSAEVKVEVILLRVLSKLTQSVTTGSAHVEVPFTKEEMNQQKKQALDYLNKIGEDLRSKGATVTAEVRSGNASEGIVQAAEEANANMIAMSTHGRTGFSRWAFGSITDKVLRLEGRIPITMVRARKGP